MRSGQIAYWQGLKVLIRSVWSDNADVLIVGKKGNGNRYTVKTKELFTDYKPMKLPAPGPLDCPNCKTSYPQYRQDIECPSCSYNSGKLESFKTWLESQDDDLRQKAIAIADKIIWHINDYVSNHTGLPYNNSIGMSLGEILPEYPQLKLKFINQPGFGKNTYQGTHNKNLIQIALPSRTKMNAIGKIGNVNKPNDNRYWINPTVAKFLSKKENYNTLVHEIMHELDGIRTKSKVFKHYPYGKSGHEYYNHPSETNAYTQSFIIDLIKYSPNVSFQDAVSLMKKEEWFTSLDESAKRRSIQRLHAWFETRNK